MRRLRFAALAWALALGAAACASVAPKARFERFVYEGRDAVFADAVADADYRNPILAGFYPDPSATQVGGDYYLVTSTFAYFPGIPVFHSTDLASWTQIGSVIDRSGMLDFDGLGLSRGVFAPTIAHHDGMFYVADTCVDCGGNFIVTADDPAGLWSDPVWLPDVGGIDPSLFFDDDGRVYLMNNDAPESAPRYDGHRAIWIREIDPGTFQSIGAPIVLIDGGVRPEENPIWIEGPHIYKVDGRYYLSAAEGGTAEGHSQVVLRADSVLGPYEPYTGNPILTQRHLPRDRAAPVTSVGHASYVTDAEGRWWATFLGVRPYEGDFYNTGRETFMLPVAWRDGWPVILEGDAVVPYAAERPALPPAAPPAIPTTGNFRLVEEFDGPLAPYWLFVRVPTAPWWSVDGGDLVIAARDDWLGGGGQPSLVARRQQHMNAEATVDVRFAPRGRGDEAGLVAWQNDDYYVAIGVGLDDAGERVVRVRWRAGGDDPARGVVIAEAPAPGADGEAVSLRVTANGARYDFAYGAEGGPFTVLAADIDGSILSMRTAGSFVGAVFGVYAEGG